MMKLKKIAAIVLAVMMIAMAGLACATTVDEPNGGTPKGQTQTNKNRSGESLGVSSTLRFEKAIKLVDADDKFFIPNVPNVVFTYAVTPVTVTAGTKVSDGLSAAEVKTGVGTGFTVTAVDTENQYTSGVKFVNNGSNTISNVGTTDNPAYIVTEKLDIDFSAALTAATQPGVYRYQIAETPILSGDNANKGYDYSGDVTVTANDTRLVDVYIRRNSSGSLEIYGYTMFEGTPAYSTTDVPKDLTAQKKTNGFTYDTSVTTVDVKDDGTAEDDRTYAQTADATITTYTTYDLVIRKTVSGAMAEKDREFDIDVLIDPLPNDDKVYYTAKDGTTYSDPATAIAALKLTAAQTAVGSGATLASTVAENKITISGMPTLKHDEYVVIKGISSGNGTTTDTKYDVMEPAAATTTYGYTMSYKKDSKTEADPTDSYDDIVAKHGNIASGKTALTKTFDLVKTADTNAFYVNNDLDAISPTGYVARYAPYGLILIGGIALLVVAKKHKKHTDEE